MVVRKSRAHIGTQVDYRVEIAAALHLWVEPAAAVRRAKLRRMESPRPRRVTLSGELSGEYLVIEQRLDGSLVLAPDRSRRTGSASARQAPGGLGSLFSGLLSRPAPGPPDVPAILEGWGVELAEEEGVDDFLIADIDGTTGFVAITTQRFIFAANTGRGVSVLQEHLLSAARNVELVGRRRKPKLHVSWHGSESVIGVLDRDALTRLEQRLGGHRAS